MTRKSLSIALAERRRAPRPPWIRPWEAPRWKRGIVRSWLAAGAFLSRLPPGRLIRRRLVDAVAFTEVEIPLLRGGPGLDGMRIAWISDLHAGHFMETPDVERIFTRVMEHSPDLVCLGGDLVERCRLDVRILAPALALLSAPLDVFAIPGNHEYNDGLDITAWRAALEDAGVRVLTNRGTLLERHGARLFVAGVDDLTHGRPDLDAALDGCPDETPILLFSHHPDLFPEAADVGIDLTLSGHTHGGQIVWRGHQPTTHSRCGYYRGLHTGASGLSRLYVGRGAGTTLLPVRIGATPEVPLITLRTRATRPPRTP